MANAARIRRTVGAAFALALVIGGGLPVLTTVVAPQSAPRAEAAPAGTALLHAVQIKHSNGAELSWDRFVPAAGATFTKYEVHRSATDNFTPSPATLLTTIHDQDVTSWVDTTAKPSTSFSYRLVADGAVSPDVRVALPAAGQAVLTLQPDGATGQTTQIVTDSSTPGACSTNRNYGGSTTMRIGTSASGWRHRGLLQFDLRDIPADATVSSASMTMSYAATTNPAVAVGLHRLRQPWTEGTETATCNLTGATWVETERGVDWGSGGSSYDGTADASLASKTRSAAGKDTFTVTALVRQWVSGAEPNHGMLLKKTSDTPGTTSPWFDYYSDDHATASLRPKLVVSYADGSQTVAPRVAVSSPAEGDRVSGTAGLDATAGDDGAVAKVEFLVGGAVVGTDTSAPYSVPWNTTGAAAGSHDITARATDDAGNQTISAVRKVTVDNSAAPTVSLTAPAANASVQGTVTVSASASASATAVEFYVDDERVGRDTVAPYSASWNTLDIVDTAYDGTHVVTARAYDAAGRVTTSAGRTVTTTNTSGSAYQADLVLNEPGNSDVPLEIPENFLDNDLAPASDAYSGDSTTTKSLDSAPKDSTQSYATYDGGPLPESMQSSDTPSTGTKGPGGTTGPDEALAEQELEYVPPATRDPESISKDALWADITVTNTSTVPWKGGVDGLQMWYRWYIPTEMPKGDGSPGDTGIVLFEGPASEYFPQTVQPGQSKPVPIVIEPPQLPTGIDKSQVRLRVDLYDVDATGTNKWYAAKGNKPIDQPVVVNRDLEGALGLEKFWQYEGEPTGAGSSTMTNVANGNMLWRWSPFFAPGRGLATMVDLTYNSLEDHSESPAGNNFSLSISGLSRWGYGLDIHPNKADEVSGRGNKFVTFTDGDGTTHKFTGTTQADGTTKWTEPAGVNLYLRSVPGADPARKWALTRPDNTTFFFDEDGYPRAVEDRNGNTLTFTLVDTPPGEDPGGPKKRVTTVTDAAGRTFAVDYYSKDEAKKAHVRGKIETITDHSGSVLSFEYYDDGNLRRLTQRGGTRANGEPLADRSFVFTYTTSNGAGPAIPNATDRVDPEPKTPNQSTRLYSIRDPRGSETVFAYYGPGSGQLRWKLKNRWNRKGDPTTACSGANFCTDFGYDIDTRRTTVNAPAARDTEYAYDVDGKVTSIVNPLEQATSLVWSNDFKVTRVTEPGGAVQTWDYNHNGYLTEHVNAVGDKTSLTYLNRSLDADDNLGHWSLLSAKTSPRGTATPLAGDFTWRFDYEGAAGTAGNLTRVTDPEDFATTYAWNLAGAPSPGTVRSTTDPNGNTTTFEYDPSGQPSKITDGEAQVTTMGYDVDGLLRWVQDPNHAAEPDPSGNGDAADRVASAYFDYDSFHRLGRQSAPKSTRYDRGRLIWSSAEYDANDNVLKRVDPHYGTAADDAENGPVSTATYDAMDQIVEQANQQDEKRAYQWDTAGRITRATKPKGVASGADADDFSSAYDYDVLDRVTRQSDFGASAGDVRRTHMCYDVPGDLRSVTSPRAALATLTCPGNGPASVGFTSTYTYDAAHRPTSTRDPLGHERRTTYDANGNTVSTEQDIDKANAPARVKRTQVSYDERDLPVKSEQRFSATRLLTSLIRYDGNGNRVLTASPRAFDQANGAAITETSAFVTSYDYDGVDRLVRVRHPFGPNETERHFTHRSYDANGNLAWTSLPVTSADASAVQDTARTRMSYFDPGWIRTSDKPANPTIRFDYAAQSWQTERVPDKKGQPGVPDDDRRMLWRFFDDGQLEERRDGDGNPSTYEYDLNNNLVEALDASGVTGHNDNPVETRASWTGFDEVARVWHRKKTDAGTDPWKFSDYSYDANGNVVRRLENGEENSGRTAVTKAPDEHKLFYDEADWLTRQLDLNDTNLDLTTAAACEDDQRIANKFFDTGWEDERKVFRADTTGCTADENSWPLKQTTTWSHFDNGKLKKLSTTDDLGALLSEHQVGYFEGGRYEDGNRTTDDYVLKRADNGTLCTNPATPCQADYDYDARLRLVQHQRRAGTVDRYTLDEPAYLIGDKTIRAGNVTTEDKAGESLVHKSYEGNQLKELSVGTATASYVYDTYGNVDCVTASAGSTSCPAAGNLVQDFAYDGLDRLASQKSYSGGSTVTDSAEYTYDALDRVTKETEGHTGTGDDRTTDFSFQGLSPLVTEEKQSGGTDPKTRTFSYDAYGHRISMTDTKNGTTATDTFTYTYDVHGSVSQLVGDAGKVKASYGYDAYGGEDEQLSSSADALRDTDTNPLNPYRFQGRRLDSGSATASSAASSMDMGARRYGVDTGRFLQQDMYASALGDLGLTLDPLSQNSYAMAGGNPVSFVEIDGHMVTADGGGGGTSDPNPTSSTTSSSGGGSSTSGDGTSIGPISPGTQRYLDEEQRRAQQWETLRDGASTAASGFNSAHGFYQGARRYASRMGYLTSQGEDFATRSRAAGQLRKAGELTSLARSPWFKRAGWAGTVASSGFTWSEYRSEGASVEEATTRTGLEVGGGLLGGAAAGVACGALGVATAGVGLLACGLGAVALGAFGSSIGKQLGDIGFDGQSVGDALGDVGGGIVDTGESVVNGVEEVGGFLNPFD